MYAFAARTLVLGMAALAVFVQLAVWGATKIRTDGALLEGWQPYFGWEYGLAFALVQLGVCRALVIERGTRWLVRTWAAVGVALLVLGLLTRGGAGLDETIALASGFGAVVLAAGLASGRLRVHDPRL